MISEATNSPQTSNDRIRSNTARRNKHVRKFKRIELNDVDSYHDHLYPSALLFELRQNISNFLSRLRNQRSDTKKNINWLFSAKSVPISVKVPSKIHKEVRGLLPTRVIQKCKEIAFCNSGTNAELNRITSRLVKITKFLKSATMNLVDEQTTIPLMPIMSSQQKRKLLRKALSYLTCTSQELTIQDGSFVRLASSRVLSSSEPQSLPSIESVKAITSFMPIFEGIPLSSRMLGNLKSIRALGLELRQELDPRKQNHAELSESVKTLCKRKFRVLCENLASLTNIENMTLVIDGTTGCFQDFELFSKVIATLKHLKKLELQFPKISSDFPELLVNFTRSKPFTSSKSVELKLKFPEDDNLKKLLPILPKPSKKGIFLTMDIFFRHYLESELALSLETESEGYSLNKLTVRQPRYFGLIKEVIRLKIKVAELQIRIDMNVFDFDSLRLGEELSSMLKGESAPYKLKIELIKTAGGLSPFNKQTCLDLIKALQGSTTLKELELIFPEISPQMNNPLILTGQFSPIKALASTIETMQSLRTLELKIEGGSYGLKFLNEIACAVTKLPNFEKFGLVVSTIGEDEGNHLLDFIVEDKQLVMTDLKCVDMKELRSSRQNINNVLKDPVTTFTKLDGTIGLFSFISLRLEFVTANNMKDKEKILQLSRLKNGKLKNTFV